MGMEPGPLLPLGSVRLDAWVLRAFEQDMDDQLDALVGSAPFLPDTFGAVLRADGGLWLVVGHRALCAVFDVPADAWMPVRPRAHEDPCR